MTRKALIVEDEDELGQLLGEHLRSWGFTPTIFNAGKDVVNWVRSHQPDLILLDLLLPDTDGYTICEALKLDRDTNLIPIVMVTALSGQEDRVRGLEVGANQYICKPFAAEDLRRAITNAFAWQQDLQRATGRLARSSFAFAATRIISTNSTKCLARCFFSAA